MKLIRAACAAAFLVVLAPAANAQTYPSRQITLVVPFAPGGPATSWAASWARSWAKIWASRS